MNASVLLMDRHLCDLIHHVTIFSFPRLQYAEKNVFPGCFFWKGVYYSGNRITEVCLSHWMQKLNISESTTHWLWDGKERFSIIPQDPS